MTVKVMVKDQHYQLGGKVFGQYIWYNKSLSVTALWSLSKTHLS